MNRRTIFARSLTAFSLLALLGVGGWFIQSSLQAVPVPPSTVKNRTVRFRADLDLSKQESFFKLHPLGSVDVTIPPAGRVDPFLPVSPIRSDTGTTTASSTVSTP